MALMRMGEVVLNSGQSSIEELVTEEKAKTTTVGEVTPQIFVVEKRSIPHSNRIAPPFILSHDLPRGILFAFQG